MIVRSGNKKYLVADKGSIKKKNIGWAVNALDIMNELNALPPGGTHTIVITTKMMSLKGNFTPSDQYGFYAPPYSGAQRFAWNTDVIGSVKTQTFTFTKDDRPFSAFYLYGCGVGNAGETGKADMEILIDNKIKFTEVK